MTMMYARNLNSARISFLAARPFMPSELLRPEREDLITNPDSGAPTAQPNWVYHAPKGILRLEKIVSPLSNMLRRLNYTKGLERVKFQVLWRARANKTIALAELPVTAPALDLECVEGPRSLFEWALGGHRSRAGAAPDRAAD